MKTTKRVLGGMMTALALGGCAAETSAPEDPKVGASTEALCTDSHTANVTLPYSSSQTVDIGTPVGATYGNPCSNYWVTEIDGVPASTTVRLEISQSGVDAASCASSYVAAYVDGYRSPYYNPITHQVVPGGWDRLSGSDVMLGWGRWTGNYCAVYVAFPVSSHGTSGFQYGTMQIAAGAWGPHGVRPVQVLINPKINT